MLAAYIDTEFTSLNRYTARLISLALVVQGGPEFYVELTDNWDEADCSGFVCEIVLPQLDLDTYGRMTEQARLELGQFLQALGDVKIASDAPSWDWPLLLELAGPAGLPASVQAEPLDLNLLDLGATHALDEPPHHALLDARLLADMVGRSSSIFTRSAYK
ncbi:hypothetical protein PH586_14870 [Pseudomonas sp. SA3-5]|uniref:Uncharacterized protein n=1 Tax=Pseudomonas aestuarii TaxID=3018340 RepID=A0ABT4XHI0_9PSED|nr:hypothetical protein [Pseudomonas aestuarii]MDA7087671.1 hypothetical protein [Pseudomonas aestuarii]